MAKILRVECTHGFRDGNAYPRYVDKGEVLEVPEWQFNRMKRSDPDGWHVLGYVIPKSTTAQKEDGSARCQAEKADGEQCTLKAQEGSKFCHIHKE